MEIHQPTLGRKKRRLGNLENFQIAFDKAGNLFRLITFAMGILCIVVAALSPLIYGFHWWILGLVFFGVFNIVVVMLKQPKRN